MVSEECGRVAGQDGAKNRSGIYMINAILCCFLIVVVLWFVCNRGPVVSETLSSITTRPTVLSPAFRVQARRRKDDEMSDWLHHREKIRRTIEREQVVITESMNKLFASLRGLSDVNPPVYEELSKHTQRCHELLQRSYSSPGDCTVLDLLDDHARLATNRFQELGLLLTPGMGLYRTWSTAMEQFNTLIRAIRRSARRRCDLRALGPTLDATMYPSEAHTNIDVDPSVNELHHQLF